MDYGMTIDEDILKTYLTQQGFDVKTNIQITSNNELDVLGIDYKSREIQIWETTGHILGLLHKDKKSTREKMKNKFKEDVKYVVKLYGNVGFNISCYHFSPVVHPAVKTQMLLLQKELKEEGINLFLIYNEEWLKIIDKVMNHENIKHNLKVRDSWERFFQMIYYNLRSTVRCDKEKKLRLKIIIVEE
jgi:hypothetical protein